MKILWRDIIVILITAAITSAIFIGVDFDKDKDQPIKEDSGYSHPYLGKKGNGKGGSNISDYISLVNKLKSYNDSTNNNVLLTRYVDTTGGKHDTLTTTLEAFTFTADQLVNLIKYPYKGNKVKTVLFYFGTDTSSATHFAYQGKNYGKITLSAIGMGENGNLLFLTTKGPAPNSFDLPNETVLDQADPCPPNGAFDAPTSAIILPAKPKK